MIKPTAKQVKEYAESIGFDLDAEYFVAKNDTAGWTVGGGNNLKPMASWKGCVRTWHAAAKRRQKKAENTEAADKIRARPQFEPRVFVQCVKGVTVGRYLPIIFKNSHTHNIENERYIESAAAMCVTLNKTDGTQWIVRENVSDRDMANERYRTIAGLTDKKEKYAPKSPLQIGRAAKKQVKAIKNEQVDGDVEFPQDDVPF